MEQRKKTVMMAVCRTRHAWADHTKAIAMEMGIPDSYRSVIVYLIRQPGANQKSIAEFSNVTTAAINQTIKEMIEEGYVRKETDEMDRRYTKLYLTEKGEITAARIRDALHRSDEIITSAITATKEDELIELLDKIYECIRRDLSSC